MASEGRGSRGLAGDYVELFGSITGDANLQIAVAAALFTAFAYQLSLKASSLLSPKLFRAYRNLKRTDQIDWNSRLPSTLHAVVVSALCIWTLCYSGDFFDTAAAAVTAGGSNGGYSGSDDGYELVPVVLRVSPMSFGIIGISFGYFVMDVLLMAVHPEISTKEMAVHHAVALLSLAVAVQVRVMHVYLLLVLLTELTTPLVNLRWWLDKAQLRHLKLYTVNGLLLLLVWGVARVMLFVPFYVHVASNWAIIQTIPLHALVLLLGVPLLLAGLNLMWFIKIVRGAYKMMFQQKKQQQQQGQQQKHESKGATTANTVAANLADNIASKTSSKLAAAGDVISLQANSSGTIKAEHFE